MYIIFIILFIVTAGEARILQLSSDDHLVSDGVSGVEASSCRHQYGFLPCAENAFGYVFMIVVYQVLLIIGDKLIGRGSEVLFYITGPQFGGILFRILRAFPSMTLMILTGVFSDKEGAQSQVSVVVGVYAGITVFSLTVQWIMCMISASKPVKDEIEKKRENLGPIKEKLKILIDNGVKVDGKTRETAGIMLLSLFPYVVLQLVYLFTTSSGKRAMTLIALGVSSLSLIFYFAYQIWHPWMQERSLDYSKLDVVQRGLLRHVEQLGKLVKEDGTVNIDLIKTYFKKADKNADRFLTDEELEELVSEVFEAGEADVDQENLLEAVMNIFDTSKSTRIHEEEFVKGFEKWIQDAMHSCSDSDKKKGMLSKAAQLLQHKNEHNYRKIDKIMSKILKQAEGHLLMSETLITNDGKLNVERIRRLFRDFDSNKDGLLSKNGLKRLIHRVKFETYHMKDDDVINEILGAFPHISIEKGIGEEDFVNKVIEYVEKAMEEVNTPERTKIIEEFDKMVWREIHGKRAFFKSIFRVLLGIAMLTFLGGPLMTNILELSNAMNFPSFIVSFVVVPLAMNARAAIAAILPASKKTTGTASLTFSEIYGGVIMNNISGLTILLAIVCAKDLTWDFSAEVLTILVVCGIIGIQAFCSTTYHLWTCIPAFLLYPISLGLFYFFQVFWGWN